MENPFELQRPAGTGTVELVVSAPGYQPQRFAVPLDRGGNWTVALVPERRGIAKPSDKKPGRKQFLENPYK